MQDPVNDYEKNRNDVIATNQGNRNPFIDNPYLATLIWGGSDAENFWEGVSVEEIEPETLEFSIYPNPTSLGFVELSFTNYELINSINIFDIAGKNIESIGSFDLMSNTYKVQNLKHGVYFIKVYSTVGVLTKKVVVK